MTLSVSGQFEKVAAGSPDSEMRSRPAPFSIRLSAEERAYLEGKAGSRPLGAYIRAKLLGDAQKRRKATRKPSVDRVALAQVLGLLGKSEQVSCLFLLLAAAEAEQVALTGKDRAALHDAFADMRNMRALLIKALGLTRGIVTGWARYRRWLGRRSK